MQIGRIYWLKHAVRMSCLLNILWVLLLNDIKTPTQIHCPNNIIVHISISPFCINISGTQHAITLALTLFVTGCL